MSEIPDSKIIGDLSHWCKDIDDCRSPACFGGWVVRIQYFQEQGVRVREDGSPRMAFNSGEHYSGLVTSKYLFGDGNMFVVRTERESGAILSLLSD